MSSISISNEQDSTSIINLELVNKNDKKLIKLNSNPTGSANRSILLTNYDITNSIDSLKTKISKIISQEQDVKQQTLVPNTGVINFVTLDMSRNSSHDDDEEEDEDEEEEDEENDDLSSQAKGYFTTY